MLAEKLLCTFRGILEPELLEEIIQSAFALPFKEGQHIIEIGQYIQHMPLLLKGAIQVLREDNEGNEILLYFLEPGAACAMTMACCMGNKKSEVRAMAETDGLIAAVPVQKMEDWMRKYPSWQKFVLDSYQQRFNELLNTVNSIAFKKLDERLWDYLQEAAKVNQSPIINKTHQEIAYALNSSRVVISRLLKNLEIQKKLILNRNTIELKL